MFESALVLDWATSTGGVELCSNCPSSCLAAFSSVTASTASRTSDVVFAVVFGHACPSITFGFPFSASSSRFVSSLPALAIARSISIFTFAGENSGLYSNSLCPLRAGFPLKLRLSQNSAASLMSTPVGTLYARNCRPCAAHNAPRTSAGSPDNLEIDQWSVPGSGRFQQNIHYRTRKN
jgi:hypothetical protein